MVKTLTRLLAMGAAMSVPTVLAAAEPKAKATFKGHTDEVYAVAFSPDGKALASAGQDATIRVWDVRTGRERLVLNRGVENKDKSKSIYALTFSPDGRTLASGGNDQVVHLWDAATGKSIRDLEGHTGTVMAVAYSPDGRSVGSSGGGDRKVIIWDPATGKVQRAIDTLFTVLCLAFSPDGAVLATGHYGQIRLWETGTGKRIRAFQGSSDESTCTLAFSPDGGTLAYGTQRKVIRLLDARTGKERATLTAHDDHVPTIAFSLDGKTLVSGAADGTLQLWEASSGSERATVQADDCVISLAFSPDGRFVATGGQRPRRPSVGPGRGAQDYEVAAEPRACTGPGPRKVIESSKVLSRPGR